MYTPLNEQLGVIGEAASLVSTYSTGRLYTGHVFYLATNKHLKYETQGEVVSLA